MSDTELPLSRELKVGGPVDSSEQPYVSREADQELQSLLKAGEFVNVVTSRQMGKTSLVYRAIAELTPQGYQFAYYDLSALRSETDARRYFQTLAGELARELAPTFDLDAFWHQRENQTVSQGFIDFFRDVLANTVGQVIVVLDEIDSTLERDFTDDLFTAIRSIYTARPREAAFKRLTFCLVGVATPNELIKTRRTTPYNIGRTIWLRDFDAARDNLAPLVRTLNVEPALANTLIARVLYWTGGQPYLTAWMCDELRREGARTPQAADALVESNLSSLDKLGHDPHFEQTQRFISERVTNGAEVLGLYERILRGKREADQAANLTYAHLKLSGLVKRDEAGNLVTRNRIYERLFNLEWVEKSKPKQALKRAKLWTKAVAAVLAVALIGGGVYYQTTVVPLQQREEARQTLESEKFEVSSGLGGLITVRPPAQARPDDLRRAIPHLVKLASGRDAPVLHLDLSGSDYVDLAGLASVHRLRLNLSRTAITDLAALRALSGLEALDVSFTKVTDLSPLASLDKLQQLDVSNTGVGDLAPLAKLTRLGELNLSRTKVTRDNLSPLLTLSALHTLALDGTGIVDFNADGRVAGLKVLQDTVPLKPGTGYQPRDTFRDCSQCPQMVVVPAGNFTMGSPPDEVGRYKDEDPPQEIKIAKVFAVGKFEVRFDEWMQCVADGACRGAADQGWGRGPRPVINISWNDAKVYTAWLAKKTGKTYRLLTEAEWEYVTRAGTTASRFWEPKSTNACAFANVLNPEVKKKYKFEWESFTCEDGYAETAPVGMFQPNAFGLYDTLGNVWEWVEDCWQDSHKDAAPDGAARVTKDCISRVIRGGSWFDFPQLVRSANRYRVTPDIRVDNFGFRVSRTLSP